MKKGFTIVELLIVIVVIGILAAITIVAYNGIQTRAQNTKTITAVKDYAKMIVAYQVDKGTWPVGQDSCYGYATCGLTGGIATTTCEMGQGYATNKASFDNMIKAVLGVSTMPQPSIQVMDCGGGTYTGAWYWSDGNTARTTYYLKGNQTCESAAGVVSVGRLQVSDITRCILYYT